MDFGFSFHYYSLFLSLLWHFLFYICTEIASDTFTLYLKMFQTKPIQRAKQKRKKQNEWLFGIISWNIRKCFGTKTEIKMKLHPENGFGYEKAESKKKTTIDWTALL